MSASLARDPETVLAALVAPRQLGDRLADGSVLVGLDAEHGFVVELEIDGARVEIDVLPRTAARSEKVFTDRFALGYRARTPGPAPMRALAACRALADVIGVNEHAVLDALAGADVSTARVRELRGGRLLRESRSGARSFYTASPYRGCSIGCRFCYAQSRMQPQRALFGLPDAPWGSWIDARVDAGERIAEEIATLSPRPIKFCPIVSDPYQPIERRLRLTRVCLDALRPWPAPVLVLTRSTVVLDDIDRLAALAEAWVGVSLPTIDDEVRTHFEPRAASVAERLDVLRSMRAAGVHTFAVVQPLLPGPVDALADALAELVDGASIDVLRGEESAHELFDRHPEARTEAWQREHALELAEALRERSVPRWTDELPPEVSR